jgi:probable phosphoglycerate mutase
VTAMRAARFELPVGASQLLLVRHGESAPVESGRPMPRLGRQADPPLDPVGMEEAELVGCRLSGEPITAIYCSPLRRTGETAGPLAARVGLTPKVEDDLREVFLGDVDGLNLRALSGAGDENVRRALRNEQWDLLPSAEPATQFRSRVRGVVETIAGRHNGEVVAVFTHGGVIGEVMAIASGSTPHAFIGADNGSITHLVVTRSRWIVRAFNETSHLRRSGLSCELPSVPLPAASEPAASQPAAS